MKVGLVLFDLRDPVVERHAVGFSDIVDGRTRETMVERRRDTARTEDFHLDILSDDSARPLGRSQTDGHRSPAY